MISQKQSSTPANILIVDDTPANLRLLIEILSEQGYKIRPTTDGRIALAAIQQELPDLILLDIVMPEMDGFMVCKALKADDRTRNIPIIFITALNDIADKVKAFSEGGVDYITRPFQAEEVLARVKTHLALLQTQQHLQEKIAELDAFVHTVAHDIKNPMGVITGNAEILLATYPTWSSDQLLSSLRRMESAAHKVAKIVDALLLLSSLDRETIFTERLDMAAIMDEVQQQLAAMIKDYQGQIVLPADWPVAVGYAPWVEEIWANYLSNALKYGGRPPHLEIGATSQEDGMIRFWVRDNGPGLSSEEQARLFTKFTRLNQVETKGHGLGLSIVKRIIDKLGGQVGVESEVGQGSTFYFILPKGEKV